MLAYCVLGAIGVFVTFRAVRAEPRSPESFRLLLPCMWVAVPVVLGGVFSVLVTPVFVAKFFIGILPGVALVVAFGVASLRPRTLRVAALLGLVAVSLIGTVRWYRAESREDWIAATAVVAAEAGPDDVVVVLPSIGGSVAEYYVCREHEFDLTAEVPDSGEPAVADVLWELKGPVMSDWPRVKHYPEWRDRYYELVDTQVFKGIDVSRYSVATVERSGGSVPPMRVWSTELKEHVGERVELQGWLLNHRPLARVDFVILRDGKGVCQIVVNDEAARAEVAKWFDETVFEVEGTPKLNRAGTGWRRAGRADVHAWSQRDAGAVAGQPPGSRPEGQLPSQSSTTPPSALRHPAPAGGVPARRAVAARDPRPRSTRPASPRSRRRRSSRRPPRAAPTSSRIDYFGRAGLPRADAAVLQADDGRRVRAGLRGRAGVPRRAARHRPPPRRVRRRSTSSSGFIDDHFAT